MSTWAPGRLDVFVRGTDNNLYHQWYASGWSGWQIALSGPITSGLAAVSSAVGRVDVFATGSAGGIYHAFGVPPSPPQPPTSAWPSATNTGVPAGTVLTPQSGCPQITVDGTVINAVHLTGCIDVEANNVTIENSEITADGPNAWWGIKYAIYNRVTGLRILHDKIDAVPGGGPDVQGGYDYGVGAPSSAGAGGSAEVGWSDISGFMQPVNISTGSVHDTYMHNLDGFTGAHTEDVYVWCGGNGVTLNHNTSINDTGIATASASIYVAPDCGPQHNVTVTDNLMAGGAYAFYGGGTGATGIVVTNNAFSTQIWPTGGYYGPDASTYWSPTNPGNIWSGNTWIDGPNAGRIINP
jgi:hypothetical protein